MKIRFLDRLQNVRREGKVAKWHDALAPELTDGLVSKVVNEWPGAAVSVPLSIAAGNTRAAIFAYGTNFNTLRAEPSGTVSFSNLFYNANKTNSTTFGIARLVFDIDSLSGQQIESGSITLSKPASAINSDNAYLYAFTRATAGTTVANDFENFGAKLSSLATYNTDAESITFVLNASGIAYVNAGSVSFMVRDWEDADNVNPTEQSNTFQSFSTFSTDFYKAAPLLDLEQPQVANRMQYEYDLVGVFRSDMGVTTDANGLVSEVANTAPTTTRSLSNLTQTNASLKPTLVGNNSIYFAPGKSLNRTTVVDDFTAFTFECFCSVEVSGSAAFYLSRMSAGQNEAGLRVASFNSGGLQFFYFRIMNGTTGWELNSASESLNFSQFNAKYGSGKKIHVFCRFKPMYMSLDILCEGVTLYSATSTVVTFTSVPTVSGTRVESTDANSAFYLYRKSFYRTFISDEAMKLLHANRANYSYSLPRMAIVSSGKSIGSMTWVKSKVITDFTASTWIFLENISGYTTAQDQIILSNTSFTGGVGGLFGFHFKIQKSSVGQAYFRFIVGNGISVQFLNSPGMTLSAFKTAYASKWVKVQCFLKKTETTDNISIAINGYRIVSTNVPTGCFITPADGLVSLMQTSTPSNNLGASNKLFATYIREIALSTEETLREYQDDKIKYNF